MDEISVDDIFNCIFMKVNFNFCIVMLSSLHLVQEFDAQYESLVPVITWVHLWLIN